jgi:hypothetical protein
MPFRDSLLGYLKGRLTRKNDFNGVSDLDPDAGLRGMQRFNRGGARAKVLRCSVHKCAIFGAAKLFWSAIAPVNGRRSQ